jgi:hypothetical protein
VRSREPLSFVLEWAWHDAAHCTRGELRAAAAEAAAAAQQQQQQQQNGEAGAKAGAEAGGSWLARQLGEEDEQSVVVVGGYVLSDMEQPAHDASATAMRERASQPRSVSLQQCVEAFLQPEQLQEGDEWYCPRCKEHVQVGRLGG